MSAADKRQAGEVNLLATPPQLWKDFIRPLAVITGLLIIALTAGIHFGVRALDTESALRERQLVRNGLHLRVEEVSELVVPQTSWDDAIRNLDNRFNASWAHDNVNEFLNHSYGFDGEFVLDAGDRPVYAALNGEDAAIGAYAIYSPAVEGLVRRVRKDEAARGPLRRNAHGDLISKAIQASALKTLDGYLTVVTATLVQPDFGTAMPSGPRAPIVITLMRIDPAFLEKFSERFLLDDVAVRLPSQPAQPGRLEIASQDETGRTQAFITWRPLNPGYSMLREMALPVFGVLLLVIVVGAFELRHIVKAARILLQHKDFAIDLAFNDPLTQLPNRTSFEEQLEWQLSALTPDSATLAVTCIQLPGLDGIADRFGVAARDDFVCIVASRLAKVCRADTLLTRIAENAFGVMTITTSADQVASITDRLRKALADPVTLEDTPVAIDFRLGTGMTRRPTDPAALIHEASRAARDA